MTIDGWTALRAYVPPKERRGFVLIDPPFEKAGEFERLSSAFSGAYRKWPTGIYMMWYPIKERSGPDALARQLTQLGVAEYFALRDDAWQAARRRRSGRLRSDRR